MIVTVKAVIGAVVERTTSSSSNHGPLLDALPVKVAGPVPRLPPPDLTVSASPVAELSAPLVPVTVKPLVPTGAEALAASVNVVDVGDEAGLNVTATPAGRPVAAKATLLLKPLIGLIVIVLLAVAIG